MSSRIKIMLDPGHIANYNRGAVSSYYEGSKMFYFANYLKEELEKYDIFDVFCTRANINECPDLLERVKMAANKNCSVFLSLHTNAVGSTGTAWGTEIYRSVALPNSVDLATKLCNDIHSLIVADVPKTKNRGVKTYKNSSGTDYYGILRHSAKYPVIKYSYIIEHIFHTTYDECAWMNQDSNLRKLAKTEAKSIADYFGAKLKEDNDTPSNDTYVNYSVVKGDTLSKIALIFYGDASKYTEIMSYNGLTNTTIYVNQELKIPNLNKDTSNDNDNLTKITGTSVATYKQLDTYLHNINKDGPSYGEIYINEGKIEGIRGDIAFAQSCLETGNFTFKGDVKKEQNNFAGIGATGGGVPGNSFDTVIDGIRAQIQHLKAYANDSALANPCIDPRFKYVARASAPYVEWLGIPDNPTGHGWASGADYGNKILTILDSIINTKVEEEEVPPPVTEDKNYVEYVVKAGDSFWKIAQNMMGNGSLYATLAAFNNMNTTSTIYAGQILKIPSDNAVKYTEYRVKSGDSFWSIAKNKLGDGNRYKEFASFNNMDINSVIHPGDVLKIPN